ncbi:MAG TPA: pyridoxamine 5'-phosphate oxidase [Candidatus Krumholzibacteria bacterium]|nr:pyridoxamine 5'-phosphate oxidase [Candidatus Krumholzibacteria bacterium]
MIDLPQLVARFNDHLAFATREGIFEPTAFSLATTGPDGRPSVRIVLLKAADERGFVFYTNTRSRKGRELAASGRAAMVFWWGPILRQVRIEGTVEPVSAGEADAYFASRARGSQIGAWASNQSSVVPSREALLAAARDIEARFADAPVPRPPHWSGYRVKPEVMEFWYGREDRLHERIEYRLEGNGWVERILSP